MNSNKRIELLSIALIILSCFFLYFFRLDSLGITDPGEGYYAEAGREMVRSGDYITPHLNYQIYFSKPILTFWITAWAYKLFGTNEFSARILFACLVLLLTISTYYLGRRLVNWRSGLFAALALAFSPLMIAMAKLSPIDITFATFLDLTIYAIIFTCFTTANKLWPFIYIALGLAALTKGPAALVLTGLAVILFILVERAPWAVYKERLKKLNILWGTIIFCLVTLPWYFAVASATNGLFIKVFFLYENLARFAGHTNLAHTTWYHYFIVLLYGFFPWLLFLPQSLHFIFKSENSFNLNPDSKSALYFLACFGIAVFLFFSFSRTQLDTYILPCIAPLAVLVGSYLNFLLEKLQNNNHKTYKKVTVLLTSFFIVVGVGAAISSQVGFHLLDKLSQKDLRRLCLDLRQYPGQVSIFQVFKPSIMFYMQRPVDSFFHTTQLIPLENENIPHSKLLILVNEKALPQLKATPKIQFKLVEQCEHWSAWEATNAKLEKVQTLAALFSNKEAFDQALSGHSDWGPLTVPYASGKQDY